MKIEFSSVVQEISAQRIGSIRNHVCRARISEAMFNSPERYTTSTGNLLMSSNNRSFLLEKSRYVCQEFREA